MERLDLLLIRHSDSNRIYGRLSDSLSAIEPPLWAALIAAYVREQGYSVRIIDAEAENLNPIETAEMIIGYEPSLVCFVVTGNNLSASTWNMSGAGDYHTSLKKRAPQIKTIFWGLHPSALPERTLREEQTDFVCEGEGFSTIAELLRLLNSGQKAERYDVNGLWYLDGNEVRSNPRALVIKSLDDLPPAAWDLLPMLKYRAHNWHCFKDLDNRTPYGVVYTSLGCPFNCSFCNLKALFSGVPGIRYRSPKKVIEDIDLLIKNYNVKNIKFLDECFVLKESHVIEICDLIIERVYDLNIWAYARVDTVNERILKKLKQAGFNWLAYGIESGSKTIRSKVSKGRYDQDDIRRAIRMTKDAGIYIAGNFMFGLPDDDFETMQETLDLAKELNCEYTNFYVTMAYPGSQLYEDAVKQGIKLPETWHGYSQYSEETLPLPTKYLSAADVLRFRDSAFKEYYSNPKYIEMIREKFGPRVVEHFEGMLKHEIHRKFV